MSKQFPGEYGRSPLYDNPEGTLPMPSPSEVPRPQWYGAQVSIDWQATAVVEPPLPPGILYTFVWTSPIFDLRPDLRSGQAGPKQGVPIWSTAARLYAQLFAPGVFTLPFPSGLTVLADEFAQTTVAQEQRRIGVGEGTGTPPNVQSIGRTDVSALFATSFAGQQSVLAGFAPPGTTLGFGDGYPVRYWRLKLNFSFFFETGFPLPVPLPPLPPLVTGSLPTTIQGAVY